MQNTIYLVTGAAGHLGTAIVQQLSDAGNRVRVLLLPGEPGAKRMPDGVDVFFGDIRDAEKVAAFLEPPPGCHTAVIHAAGIVSIASRTKDEVHSVNVEGTRNLLTQCKRKKVARLVYVSSVHAIPERPAGEIICETDRFDPALVEGGYAKTKAEATSVVLQAAQSGLNASVVHPSGIFGPFDWGHGHLTQLVLDYMRGRLTACVEGGYDFVDVRDVAAGTIACCDKGRPGECYILSGRYYAIADVLYMLHRITGRRKIRRVLPYWFVKSAAPLCELYYRLLRQPPLFTSYSIDTLRTNAHFSHDKAARELGYDPRPIKETLKDMVEWLQTNGRV